MENKTHKKCPRCESVQSQILSHSPVKDAWCIYHCSVCFFTWRSCEPDFITDPDKYNVHFKFKPEDMEKFAIMPSVPELLKSNS